MWSYGSDSTVMRLWSLNINANIDNLSVPWQWIGGIGRAEEGHVFICWTPLMSWSVVCPDFSRWTTAMTYFNHSLFCSHIYDHSLITSSPSIWMIIISLKWQCNDLSFKEIQAGSPLLHLIIGCSLLSLFQRDSHKKNTLTPTPCPQLGRSCSIFLH